MRIKILLVLFFLCLSTTQASAQIFGEAKIKKPKIDRIENRLKNLPQTPNHTPDKYALLVSGKPYTQVATYQANLSISYQVLLELGFSSDKIFILEDEGYETFLFPNDGPANGKNIDVIFKYFSRVIDDQDIFFIYITGHGGWNKGYKKVPEPDHISTIILGENFKDQRMFAEFLDSTHPKVGVLVFDECFSGGFALELGKRNFIAIAASAANKVSASNPNDSFGGFFMKAFRDKSHSDKDGDYKVSIEEAFKYACTHDTATKSELQKPFIKSDLDPKTVFLQ